MVERNGNNGHEIEVRLKVVIYEVFIKYIITEIDVPCGRCGEEYGCFKVDVYNIALKEPEITNALPDEISRALDSNARRLEQSIFCAINGKVLCNKCLKFHQLI